MHGGAGPWTIRRSTGKVVDHHAPVREKRVVPGPAGTVLADLPPDVSVRLQSRRTKRATCSAWPSRRSSSSAPPGCGVVHREGGASRPPVPPRHDPGDAGRQRQQVLVSKPQAQLRQPEKPQGPVEGNSFPRWVARPRRWSPPTCRPSPTRSWRRRSGAARGR